MHQKNVSDRGFLHTMSLRSFTCDSEYEFEFMIGQLLANGSIFWYVQTFEICVPFNSSSITSKIIQMEKSIEPNAFSSYECKNKRSKYISNFHLIAFVCCYYYYYYNIKGELIIYFDVMDSPYTQTIITIIIISKRFIDAIPSNFLIFIIIQLAIEFS